MGHPGGPREKRGVLVFQLLWCCLKKFLCMSWQVQLNTSNLARIDWGDGGRILSQYMQLICNKFQLPVCTYIYIYTYKLNMISWEKVGNMDQNGSRAICGQHWVHHQQLTARFSRTMDGKETALAAGWRFLGCHQLVHQGATLLLHHGSLVMSPFFTSPNH